MRLIVLAMDIGPRRGHAVASASQFPALPTEGKAQ